MASEEIWGPDVHLEKEESMKVGREELSWEDSGWHGLSYNIYARSHVHTCVYEQHQGEVLFLCCCPTALDQTRDARSQGMEPAGVRACDWG